MTEGDGEGAPWVVIRPAVSADLPGMAAIYNDAVRHSVATFDVQTRPDDHYAEHLRADAPGDHVLVAVAVNASGRTNAADVSGTTNAPDARGRTNAPDASGRTNVPDATPATSTNDAAPAADVAGGHDVLGYAFSGVYRPRAAYDGTREVSIYLADAARGRGIGRRLYTELFARVDADGIHTCLAVIATPNPASEALHTAFGFEHVGTLREVGRKFDRWVDTALWQRRPPSLT